MSDETKRKSRLFIPATSSGKLSETTHLCIAAHQDDIELMASGAVLQCYGKSSFTGVVVTNGAGSPRSGVYANYTDEQMQEIREREQDDAASIGRYNAQMHLYYPSSAVKSNTDKDLIDELVDIILATNPDVLLTHNFADKHDTHLAVATRVLQALRKIPAEKRPHKVYSMEVWRALDWVNDSDKVLFDTSGDEFMQAAMLGAFHSQIAGGKRYDLAGLGRKRANATYFASHDTDNYTAAEYALDITELVNDATLTPAQFIGRHIDNFKADVNMRLAQFE